MNRGSSQVYLCTSTPTKTDSKTRSDFQLSENCLPKLVDYSFSDENDSGNDSRCSLDESWDKLQVSLDSLATSFSNLDTSRTRLNPSGFNRHLHERASLRLKAEENKEESRKKKVMKQLNGSFGATKTKPRRRSIYEIFGSSKRIQQDGRKADDDAILTAWASSSKDVGLKRQARSLPILDAPRHMLDISVRVCEDEMPAKRRRIDFASISAFASKRFSFRSKAKKLFRKPDVRASQKGNCLFSCFKTSGSYTFNV